MMCNAADEEYVSTREFREESWTGRRVCDDHETVMLKEYTR